ncbi:hypothetical protein BD410DRAFT_839071 [Rickenella mellea]|uniref:Uncharacterized protein n=1 Tax=Rickenella mellea TaxID=50990 RepID=A0A4Y7Q8D6_9AGAM|nr:hypothetical protein BD410DRAFT_839071 [Rickenella mellea]
MATHPIHTTDPAYAAPVLRLPSPANSLSTEYGQDETTADENQMTEEQFARMCEEQIGLNRMRADEIKANKRVLLPRTTNTTEERMLHEEVMRSLRDQVAALEQEELFEAAMLRNSQAALAVQPSSRDIDVIMRSMLYPRSKPSHGTENAAFFGNGDDSGRTVEMFRHKVKGKERCRN